MTSSTGTLSLRTLWVSVTVLMVGCSEQLLPAPAADDATPAVGQQRQALAAGCGNGVLEPESGEACDDGNIVDLDGCTTDCAVEPGFVCIGEHPSLCSSPDQSDAPASYGVAQHSRFLPSVSPFTGRDFWTGFPRNLGAPTTLALKIAGAAGTTGQVLNTAGTVLSNFTIPASGTHNATVDPVTYHVASTSVVTNQGVHITANAEIRIVATDEHTYTTDSWALWATDKLGVDYLLADLAGTSIAGQHQVLIIATRAGTTAVLKNVAGTTVATIALGAGQTYLYPAASGTLGGYTVTSNNPIAVITGSSCENLPGSACDMLAEQLPPTRNWAKDYVAGPAFLSASAQARHAVFASQNTTSVVITRSDGNTQTTTLNAGQSFVFAEPPSLFGYVINADKPVLVASVIGDSSATSDPSLVYWPPIDGFVSSARMPTPAGTVVYINALTLTARTAATSFIKVNGAAVPGWIAISSTGYSFARIGVPVGDNEIIATNGVKFGAVATGGAPSVSYGYASPYDIGAVGGTTNCYLGTNPPDYEAALSGAAACDADDLSAADDEDALTAPTSARLAAAVVTIDVPCNDNYFGLDVTAIVNGFIDFNRDGVFGPGESASGACTDASPLTNGSATLTWNNPVYDGIGSTVIRLRTCDTTTTCTSASGLATAGEVEDHVLHIGVCADGFVDSFDACDDGNTTDNDGCSATCTLESGFTCSGSPSVCLLNTAPAITSPATGALTNDATPTVSGTCVTGALVTVKEGAGVLCTTTCAGGAFSCDSSALSEGSHLLQADQKVGGFTSVPSATITVNVDSAPPGAPAINGPASGAILSTATPIVSGACEPGATVTVLNGSASLCTATCTAASTFSCTTSALPQGAVTLTATQRDVGNNLSVASPGIEVSVDTVAPAAPAITAPAAGAALTTTTPTLTGTCETGATVKVFEGLLVLCQAPCVASAFSCTSSTLSESSHVILVRQYDTANNASPFSGSRSFTVTAPPAPPAPDLTAPTAGSLLNTGTPTFQGTCVSGATVNVYEGATLVCSTGCTSAAFSCTGILSEGAHTVVARQTNANGTSANSASRSFSIDATAPAAPALSSPSTGALLTSGAVVVSGSCETGATVTVLEGTTPRCSTVCAGSAFSCTTASLADGIHVLGATQLDPAGNPSPSSSTVSITVDATAPAAPAIATPAAGPLGTATPIVSGSCETGSTVRVYEGATLLCTSACSASTFSCTSAPLTQGSHTLLTRQTDEAGNLSPNSPAVSVTVDTVAPPASAIGSPAASAVLATSTPIVSGSCETGATVEILEGASVLCTATCVANAFSCTSAALTEGSHTLSSRQTDAAGNVSTPSAGRTVTIDTVAPAAVVISSPADGALLALTTPAFSGSCETGAMVTVSEGASVLCSTVCTASTFSCTSAALSQGNHSVVASQKDAAGNQSLASAAIAVSVDTVAPIVPVITSPTAGSVTNATQIAIVGSCESGATVTASEAGQPLCTAVCSSGSFSCSSPTLGEGLHTVTVQQQDATGNLSPASTATSFTIDLTAPASPGLAQPTEGQRLQSPAVSLSGSCEAGAIVSVYEGSALLCTASCVSGAFECTTAALGEGSHSVVVHQTDPANNTSASSGARSFSIDSLAPIAPALSSPAPDAFLTTATPTFSGTCESGSMVSVAEGSTDLCTTVCTSGVFSCTPAALTDGNHVVTATQRDATGNLSPASGAMGFTVDTAAPLSPVLASPVEGVSTPITAPTFAGSCESGTIVEVLEGTTVLCSATCLGEAFSCTAPTLTEGTHSVVTRQTDLAGNVSPNMSPRSFIVDATAPNAPVVTAPVAAAFLGDTTPELSGTCESGTTVNVYEGTALLCTATCAGNAFACTSTLLSDASHTISVEQLDAAGNLSPSSAPRTFTVDSTLPATPDLTSPASGSFVGSATPLISGTCESSSTVTVYEGTTTICQAVCSSGVFSCAATTFNDGAHTLIARQVDLANNSSGDSGGQVFTVDTAAPEAAAILFPTPALVTATVEPVITGTCESFATVVVMEGSTLVCQATCADGTFSCTAAPFADGTHALTVSQTDRAGNSSTVSTAVSFRVDTQAPIAATIASPLPNAALNSPSVTFAGSCESAATVQIYEGSTLLCQTPCAASTYSCLSGPLTEGGHDVFARQVDSAGNIGIDTAGLHFAIDLTAPAVPVLSTPSAGMASSVPVVTVAGSCETGSSVEVFEGTVLLCQAPCVASTFNCATSALGDGAHALTVRQTDIAGNPSARSAPLAFSVDTIAPAAPAVTAPIASGFLKTATPSVSGTCESGTTVEVSEGALVLCTATCAGGTFACTLPTMSDGNHTLTVRQTDAAGNVSAPSQARSFTVDTVAPTAPIATSPTADQHVFDSRAIFAGTGEPGSTVTVSVDGSPVCSAVVSSAGDWTCTATTTLPAGAHTMSAKVTDAAGNGSAASMGVAFIQEHALTVPTITSPTEGARLDGPKVTVTGTAYPNSAVTVSDQDGVICTTTASDTGTFSCTGDVGAGLRTLTTHTSFKGFDSTSAPVEVTVLMDVSFGGSGFGCSAGGGEIAFAGMLLVAAMLRRRRTARAG